MRQFFELPEITEIFSFEPRVASRYGRSVSEGNSGLYMAISGKVYIVFWVVCGNFSIYQNCYAALKGVTNACCKKKNDKGYL